MNSAHTLAQRLHQVTALLSRESDQVLQAQLGIGLSQYKILLAVQKRSRIKQVDIAHGLGQSEASVSRQIKLLQQKGALHAMRNPNNRREHVISLTTSGQRLINAADKILNSFHQSFFSTFNDGELRRVSQSLASKL